jgi:hypothetical protein
VSDNYCLFYLNFRKPKFASNAANAYDSQEWKIWSGLTFENICMYHQANIIKKLGLNGIKYAVSNWHHKGDETMSGAQIDMVIDRVDKLFYKVFPNPSRDFVRVQYQINHDTEIQTQLYDLAGKKVFQSPSKVEMAGENLLELDMRPLPTGTYLLHLLLDGRRVTERVVKVE